jgi:RimJ/RimL family protein N-acetyltransferase
MGDFRLETGRLVLRNWAAGDLARFAAVANTPEVMRWLGGPADRDALQAAEGRLFACHERYGHCLWLVERHADGGHLAGEVLGFCGLKRADAPGEPIMGEFEIGWRLREDAWGKGYAREAAAASLDAAFERFGAPEVFAITIVENTASWGLMKRLGMRRREDLDYDDMRFEPPLRHTITYSITPDEWKAQAR